MVTRSVCVLLGARVWPLGMLRTIMRPMLAAMAGRDFRSFMEAFLRYAEEGWGKVFNYAWSQGMGIGPIIAFVFLWDDPGSAGGLGGGTAALLHDHLIRLAATWSAFALFLVVLASL